jgi:tRNA(Ile)-lysidine synthase
VPTLVACSGGADSTALLLALALASRDIAAAFIIHDLRTRELELADARFVEELCEHLRIPFILGEVTSEGGNAEGRSRDRRYALLAKLAHERGITMVATAHHADDQLESQVMALLRGSGPAGLRGVAPRRPLEHGVTLIRPMLRCTREDARVACARAGVTWREDHTNDDTRRLRAALRAGPIAELIRLRPRAPLRAAETADLMRQTHDLVRSHAAALARTDHVWTRDELRAQPALIIGEVLRAAARELLAGEHADALPRRAVAEAVRAIRDTSTEPRRFGWSGGIIVTVTAREVRIAFA